jgi:hypothetical protein
LIQLPHTYPMDLGPYSATRCCLAGPKNSCVPCSPPCRFVDSREFRLNHLINLSLHCRLPPLATGGANGHHRKGRFSRVCRRRWTECGRRRCECTGGTRWRSAQRHGFCYVACVNTYYGLCQDACGCARRLIDRGRWVRVCRRRWVDVCWRPCGCTADNGVLPTAKHRQCQSPGAVPRRIQYYCLP